MRASSLFFLFALTNLLGCFDVSASEVSGEIMDFQVALQIRQNREAYRTEHPEVLQDALKLSCAVLGCGHDVECCIDYCGGTWYDNSNTCSK